MKKSILSLALGLSLAAGSAMITFGADGRWIPSGSDWQYERADGSLASGSWENVDGEWYHFNSNSLMDTGWNKIDNVWYYFEASGKLGKGWQTYSSEDGIKTFYFDESGNAATGWKDIDGNRYWFSQSGVLNTDTTKSIGGRKYYFNEDGTLLANRYVRFKYYDSTGTASAEGDIKAEKTNGVKLSVEDDVKEDIADVINALPNGWLQKFEDDGWRFIYCPDKEYYSSTTTDDDEKYYILYKLSTSDKELYFTDSDGIAMGFGEYIYRNASDIVKELDFDTEAQLEYDEIMGYTGLPEAYRTDSDTTFGGLFATYQDEDEREGMSDYMLECVETIINSRNTAQAALES